MSMHEINSSIEGSLEFNPWELKISPFNECYSDENKSIEPLPVSCSGDTEFSAMELNDIDESSGYIADTEDNEFNDESDENNSPLVVPYMVNIRNQEILAIVDNRLSVNIITTPLLDQLNYQVDKISHISSIILGEILMKPVGIIAELPINIDGILVSTSAYVLSSQNSIFIIGTNWTETLLDKEYYYSFIKSANPYIENFTPEPPDRIATELEISFNSKNSDSVIKQDC